MKKIIEYIDSIKDGGAETLIKDYALFLDKKEFEVTIVTWLPLDTYESANAKIIKDNNIKIISMYKRWNCFTKLFHKFCKYWFLPFELILIIKKINPDVLHVHLPILRYVSPARRFLRNLSLFYTCHNDPDIMFSTIFRPGEDKAARVLIKENNLRLIALHEEMKNKLNQRFNISNAVIVHNGINFERFLLVNKRKDEIKKSLGIKPDVFIVGNIGRITDQKNHMFLIDVFAALKKHISNAFLLIVGDGKLKQNIEKKIQEYNLNDSYMILSHRTDIPELLKAMDVFVFPSVFEGLSVTLVEAQIAGLRCIVSKNINRETFISPQIKVLDINDSPEKWASSIMEKTPSLPPFAKKEDFDIKNAVKTLEALYRGHDNA